MQDQPAKGENRPPSKPKRTPKDTSKAGQHRLHVDVNDVGLPLSAVLTSASVHDSQVAITLI